MWPSRTRHFIVLSLGAGLAFNFATNIFSVISHRPLQHDGAYWFFVILRDGWFNWSGRFLDRWFHAIWQAPTVLLVNIAGTRDWLRAELFTFEFSYCVHPFLSLALSAWICRRAQAPWMFLFPLASYALATNLTHGYAESEVATSLGLFWPLYFLVLLKPFSPARRRLAIVALTLALAGTHSWAFMLFPILLLPTLAPFWDSARRPSGEALAQTALFSAAAAWLLYLGAIVNGGQTEAFFWAFTQPWGAITRIAIPGSVVFALLAAWGGPKRPLDRRVCWGALGAASIAACIYLGSALAGDPFEARATIVSFFGRIPAIPLGCFLALSLFFIDRRIPRSAWAKEQRWRLAAASLVPLLLIAGVTSIGQVLNWRQSLELLRTSMARDPRPCVVLSERDWDAWFVSRGNSVVGLPALSMLLQGTNTPTQIVAQEVYVRDVIRRDFCSRVAKGIIAWPEGDDDLSNAGHLNIDRIIAKLSESRPVPSP